MLLNSVGLTGVDCPRQEWIALARKLVVLQELLISSAYLFSDTCACSCLRRISFFFNALISFNLGALVVNA